MTPVCCFISVRVVNDLPGQTASCKRTKAGSKKE